MYSTVYVCVCVTADLVALYMQDILGWEQEADDLDS